MSCRYCENEQLLSEEGLTLELYLNKGEIKGFCGWCGCWSKAKVNYCPMCGRKVGEDESKKSNRVRKRA